MYQILLAIISFSHARAYAIGHWKQGGGMPVNTSNKWLRDGLNVLSYDAYDYEYNNGQNNIER